MKNLLSLIRFPNLLMMLLTQVLVRVYLVFPERTLLQLFSWRFMVLLLATTCVAAAGYIINDYYDLKIDRINKPDRIVVGRGLTRRKAMMVHLYLSGLGVALGILLGWRVGLVMLGAVLLLWGYSAQLKRLPLVGNATIALLTGAMVLVVPLQAGQPSTAAWAYGIFAGLISLIREIVKDIEDQEGDASFRCRTLPIVLGLRKTKWVVYVLLVPFLVFAGMVALEKRSDPWFLVYWLALVMAPSVWFWYQLFHADTRRAFSRLSGLCKAIMLAGICSMGML